MLAEADIVQDTRKLWEWALEQFLVWVGSCPRAFTLNQRSPFALGPPTESAPPPLPLGEGWGEGVGTTPRSRSTAIAIASDQRPHGKKRTTRHTSNSLTSISSTTTQVFNESTFNSRNQIHQRGIRQSMASAPAGRTAHRSDRGSASVANRGGKRRRTTPNGSRVRRLGEPPAILAVRC